MAGTNSPGRRRLGAVLLAALVVLSVLGGVAGTGTAHGEGDHVTRNDRILKVVVGDEHFDGKNRNVTVQVENATPVKLTPKTRRKARNETVYRTTLGELNLGEANGSLKNANVTVSQDNQTLFNETLDLRIIEFGNANNVTLEGRTLSVPLKQAVGFTDGASVPVKLDGKSKAVKGKATVKLGENEKHLEVTLKPAKLSLPLSQKATVEIHGNANAPSDRVTNVPLRERVRERTSLRKLDDETVVVTNPLLTKNSEYVLDIRTGSGRYTNVTRTDGKRALTVTDPALADATRFTVTVSKNGSVVFDNYQPPVDEEAPETGALSDDGTRVTLSDETLSAQSVTVWLTNESDYVRVSVPVANESVIDLSTTDYRLASNGTYRLVVEDDGTFLHVVVEGNRTGTTMHAAASKAMPTGNATNGTTTTTANQSSPGGLTGPGGLDVTLIGGALFVLLFGVSAIALFLRNSGGRSTTGGGEAVGSGQADRTVKVEVKDGMTDSLFHGEAIVTAKHDESGTEKQEEATNGEATFRLETGTWTFEAEGKNASDREEGVDVPLLGAPPPTLLLGPKRVKVEVYTDDDTDEQSNIPVRCSPDVGQGDTDTTDQLGQADFEVPLDANEVTVSADHEKYEGDETTVAFGTSETVQPSLTLRKLTGDLRVTATVDGTAMAGVGVRVAPKEDAILELDEDGRTATTGADGVVTFDGLVAGEYEVSLELPAGEEHFSIPTERVRIRDGQSARASLDATFRYSLGTDERNRIDAVRRDAESLADASGRDVAIPYYYGTVVTDLLDAVERVGTEGHRFARVDADPDDVVTALLDATEETVRVIDNAMSTKRNIDLFGACVDLPDEHVEWSGEFDPDDLFELLDEDRTTQRQTVLERLRKVDDRIDDERSGLAEVAPARELWERVQEFVNSERGEDLVRGAAVAFVASGTLDAVDELFDHEPLRERLERTVF